MFGRSCPNPHSTRAGKARGAHPSLPPGTQPGSGVSAGGTHQLLYPELLGMVRYRNLLLGLSLWQLLCSGVRGRLCPCCRLKDTALPVTTTRSPGFTSLLGRSLS